MSRIDWTIHVFQEKLRSYMASRLTPALEGRPIRYAEIPTLTVINYMPGCSIKDICLEIARDKGVMTNRIQHLLEIGMVEDRSTKKNSYKLYLTEAGRAEFEYADGLMRQFTDEILVNLTDDERGSFETMLKKITQITDCGYTY
jgi:DNA-binding MarR family transcriptional regulator